MSLPARIERKIERVPIAGCWIWTAHASRGGYGRVVLGGKVRQAHRVVYELLSGEIPAGLQIDHLCRNRLCVNPAHLEPVTQQVNFERAGPRYNALKTRCIRGHPFDTENTVKDRRGKRFCRACRAIYRKRYKK